MLVFPTSVVARALNHKEKTEMYMPMITVLASLSVFEGCISRRWCRAGVTINKSIKEGGSEREGRSLCIPVCFIQFDVLLTALACF